MEKQLFEIVKGISKLLDNRFDLLQENNCRNLFDYSQGENEKTGRMEIIPEIILQITLPFSQIDLSNPELDWVETESKISRINLLGRAVGIEILVKYNGNS